MEGKGGLDLDICQRSQFLVTPLNGCTLNVPDASVKTALLISWNLIISSKRLSTSFSRAPFFLGLHS